MSLPQIAGLELKELIGRGSCGAVYRAERIDTGEACAVKVFNSMAINRKLLAIAMRGMQQMPDHPGLLRPTEFVFDNSPFYCAMPLVGFATEDAMRHRTWETPTLESCCGKSPPDQAWRYIYEICDAMSCLHRHNLVHCNLKPRNVLIEDDRGNATKITDPVQGWIGGIHHFESTDHFMFIPPEQAEHPDALPVQGTQWDVYSFGVLAFRLLTGQFPRGAGAYDEQIRKQDQAQGMIHVVDNGLILHAVRSQPDVHWPAKPTSKWDERRKGIIDQCLSIDPKNRWPDLREVLREFERLEAELLLEDARQKIEIEKQHQARMKFLLPGATAALGCALVITGSFGLWYGLATWHKWQNAEKKLAGMEQERQTQLAARESHIESLTKTLDSVHEEKRLTDANLQMSHEAVDQFLAQLLQMPTGMGLEAEISGSQLNDALKFYKTERERLKDDDSLLPERARNYFNTAQLLLRKQQRAEAMEYLTRARAALLVLRQKQPDHNDAPRREALLGRACRWLGTLKADDGHRGEALELFQQAVAALESAASKDAKDRGTRLECASAWYELGRRARRDGRIADAGTALEKIPALLKTNPGDTEPTNQEMFLLARGRIEQGLAQRESGATQQAMKSLFDAMEEMVKLVEKQKPSPQREEMALTLAEAYTEFGDTIAGKLGGNDAKESHVEALKILMELVRVHPQWGEARHLLGRSYGAIASLERDLGNPTEAQRRQTMAVQTLTELAKLYPQSTRYAAELARQKGQHAQLFCDLNKPKEAIPLAEEAIASLEATLKKEAAMDALDRKDCGVLMAQLYGTLGRSGELSKNNKLAKNSYAKAAEQWEKLKAMHGTDETIQQGLAWTKDRLRKLK